MMNSKGLSKTSSRSTTSVTNKGYSRVRTERHNDHCNTRFYCERGSVLHGLEEKESSFYALMVEFG